MTKQNGAKKLSPQELEDAKKLFKQALLEAKKKKIEKILKYYPGVFAVKRTYKTETNRLWLEVFGEKAALPYPEVARWSKRLRKRLAVRCSRKRKTDEERSASACKSNEKASPFSKRRQNALQNCQCGSWGIERIRRFR